MRHINISSAISLAALAAGLGTSAFGQVAPYQSYQEQPAPNKQNPQAYFGFALDFSKKSANPNIDYPSFPNPRNTVQNVRYMPYSLVAGSGSGACFEISSNSAPAGSDLLLSVQNAANNWVFLADDNAGNGQFWARIYVPNGHGVTVRISEYLTWISEGQQNTVNQANIGVVKVNADPGSAVTASSCRVSGKPFWQPTLNSGNPYNPS
jgi:hypothetical protein